MKKTFSKVVAVALALTFATTTSALTAADIQLLVSMGVIPADKAAAALAAIGGSSTTSTASCGVYTRDLTLGSTGADVVSLQTFLEAKGFLTIPVGTSKGYFGTLTQSALGRYQAANGIAPTAGYFGPVTRAKVSSDCTPGTTTPGTTTPGKTLSGDEARLDNYRALSTYSNEDIEEGETGGVFAAEFKVRDGDIEIDRVDVAVEAGSGSEDKPWRQIESIALIVNGEEVDSKSVDRESDWSRKDSTFSPSSSRAYETRFTGLGFIVDEDETATIEVEITTSDSIDNSKLPTSWRVWIPRDGLRAVDGKGIDQYVGSQDDYKTFNIEAADDGKVRVRESDDDLDPSILVVDANKKSSSYEVFRFEIDNSEDADVLLNTLTILATSTTSDLSKVISKLTVEIDGDRFDFDSSTSTATHTAYLFDLEDNGDEFEIGEDDRVEVVVKAEFAKQSGNYADGTTVQFGIGRVNGVNDVVGITAEGASTNDPSDVDGRVEGSIHTLRTTGVAVEVTSKNFTYHNNTADSLADDEGEYRFTVKVTALEDDAWINNQVALAASTTAGFVATVTGDTFAGTSSARIADTSAKTQINGRYKVAEGTSETFIIAVRLDPSSQQTLGLKLTGVNFAADSTTGTFGAFVVPDIPANSIPTEVIKN